MGRTNKGKRSKRYAQQVHFKRRLQGRYEIEDVEKFKVFALDKIRTDSSTFIEKESNRVSHHMIHYEGNAIRVVYDRIRRVLVTVLVPEEVT